jgi:hypothetical protein
MENWALERGGLNRERTRRGCYLRGQGRLQMEILVRCQFCWALFCQNRHADILYRSLTPSRSSSNRSAFSHNYSSSAKPQSRLLSTASISLLSALTAPSISSIGSFAALPKNDTTTSSLSVLPLASSRLCSTSTLLGYTGQDSASSCDMAVWWMERTSAEAG